jgi:FkbM family methyltransferase
MQPILTLKLIARNILKPRPDLKIGMRIPKTWLGIDSAGFFVHLPTLNKDSVVYSFGIGEDITFDRHLIEKTGCRVFAFDPTPKSIEWLRTQVLPDGFVAHPVGISPETGKMKFRLPHNKNHVSGSLENAGHVNDSDTVEVDVKRLSDLMRDLGHSRIDLLKMDIEGSEYAVIDQILTDKIDIKQLVVEVHERYLPDGKILTEKMVKKLQENGYQLFAKSLSREELSFIKM